MLGRIPQPELFKDLFREAVLLASDVNKGESSHNPSLLLVFLEQLSLLELDPLHVCVDILEERFNLRPEDDRSKSIIEFLFSQAAQIQKLMGFYLSLEIF